MARLMSVHRSGVPPAYLLNFGNGGDGLLKGEEGNSGADVTSLLQAKHNTQNVVKELWSGPRSLKQPPYVHFKPSRYLGSYLRETELPIKISHVRMTFNLVHFGLLKCVLIVSKLYSRVKSGN